MAESLQAVILPSAEAVAAAAGHFKQSECVFANGALPDGLAGRADCIVLDSNAEWVDSIVELLKASGSARIRWGYESIESVNGPALEWVRRVISGNEYKAPAPQAEPSPASPPFREEEPPAEAGPVQDAPERDWSDFPPIEAYAEDERAETALRSIRTASALKSQAHESDSADWGDPADHFRDFALPKFDPEWIPPQIRAFVTNIAAQQGCDLGIPAIHALTVASICISDDIKISVKPRQDWQEAPRLWTCVVGPSGDGKSPSLTAILKGITPLTIEIAERSKKRMAEFKDATDVYDLQRKAWLTAKAKGDPCGLAPMAPERPVEEQLYFDDFTVEGIADVLQQSSRGSSCIVDELLGVLASFNRYRPGNDRQFFLQAWSGGRRAFNRAGGRKWVINDCGLSLCGNSQPRAIQEAVKSQGLESDGLVQRVIVYHSLRDADSVTDTDADVEAARAWKSLCERLYYLKTNLDHCYFSPDAQDIFRGIELWIKEMRPLLPSDAAQEALSKWRGYAARLALVFHCIESAQAGREVVAAEVHEDTMARVAAFMCDGIFPHLEKFYSETIGTNQSRANAVRIVATWIVCRPEGMAEITLRDIAQYCQPAWYPEGTDSAVEQRRKGIITELTAHSGWLRPVAPGKPGQLPTRFYVNPAVDTKYSALRETLLPIRKARYDGMEARKVAKRGKR